MRNLRRYARPALLALLGVVAADCGAAPFAKTPEYELTDLTGAYVEFFDRTRDLAKDARVAAFKTEMGAKLPGFYDAARMPEMTTAQYDADLGRSFDEFPQRREAFMQTAASFRSMLQPAIESFAGTFTDFQSIGPIILLHSLGEMDGGTRTVGGKRYLIFGADVMAKLIPRGKERPFFHHELFHVYDERFFGECDALWCALWTEGLAVYVSEQLNPGATDTDLLLTSPRPIRPTVDANLAKAVCAIRARLDSTEPGDYAAFFFGNSSFGDLPPRAGYYLGYLALKQAGKRHSPGHLAHFDQKRARPALESALAGLATCR